MPAALGGPLDESQSQFIDVKTWSQELRFTSPKTGGFSWIAGAYFLHIDRFISTGNLADRGDGVPAVYYTPLVDPTNPFATNTNVPFSRTARPATPGRYLAMRPTILTRSGNSTPRSATTDDMSRTPPTHRPFSCRTTTAFTGEVRNAVTSMPPQPKATLRYKPDDD